ncbi:MAG: hypothetical protein FWD13_12665 [Treponema sp.]|nr:hypothetical protein [Treponema sp.]
MNKEKFQALLPIFISALIKKIIEQKNISQDEALSRFYNSKLYILLDDEQTKVWHYSTEKLYHLYEEEMNTGNFELPEC